VFTAPLCFRANLVQGLPSPAYPARGRLISFAIGALITDGANFTTTWQLFFIARHSPPQSLIGSKAASPMT